MIRTSLSHPLRIDEVAVPGTAGTVGMTLCPGKIQQDGLTGTWARDLARDLQAIEAWGATTMVTLMQSHELEAFRVEDLPRAAARRMKHLHLPIPDGGVPDGRWEAAWEQAGPRIREALDRGEKVLVHCLGGLGRTGMVTARLLVEFGMEPGQAIRTVRAARPGTIETQQQEAYVLGLSARVQSSPASLPRPYHPIPPERASRFRGCLLGGAAGDALGAPVEFLDLKAIRSRFGAEGIRDFAPAFGRLGAITDDTQMSLFTAEGLLRHVAGTLGGGPAPDPVAAVGDAYLRWLATQGHPVRIPGFQLDGWLVGHQELFSARAPGNTCLSALQARRALHDGTPAGNGSKGCGGIMRAAPVGLYAATLGQPSEQAFAWGCAIAGLTHGHPTGQYPAGVLAMLVCGLLQGWGLPESISAAKELLLRQPGHEETFRAVEAAERLAAGPAPVDGALAELGQGWVAEEALAIALFCALRARNLEEGIVMAVNITGDSDSTGAIAGNLLGAVKGVHEIPIRWLASLELREAVIEMADDLATAPAWDVQDAAYWRSRYPAD
ncbi:MAG TPA: ADP-ribosylglycohydrolase family protein [Holophaga sp.]|nr:ADP-ribosylglycohydrolase family protein [Holophaga sp.]